MKFNIGDRVKVIFSHYNEYKNKLAIITAEEKDNYYQDSHHYYQIKFINLDVKYLCNQDYHSINGDFLEKMNMKCPEYLK